MRKGNYLLCLLLLALGCSPALYKPDPASTGNTEYEKLMAGRSHYVASCGSCHTLYLPKQFSSETWVRNLDEMQQRAHISDSQKELILNYLNHGLAN